MGESEIKLLHLLTEEGKELFHKYAHGQTLKIHMNVASSSTLFVSAQERC